MARSITSLPTAQSSTGSDMVALWSAAVGGDAKLPASKLPISTATQEALDALEAKLYTGLYINASTLLADHPELLAQVRNPSGGAGQDMGNIIQQWFDSAYLLGGSEQTGAGGHGCTMDLEPGTYTWSTLLLKPGMALRGLTDRFEVRVKQPSTARAPIIDILGRGQNQDVLGRRTAVILQRLDFACNGNLDDNGDPINGINLRVDPGNEGDDESANRTGLIAEEVQVGGASGWGMYNLKRGKMWLNKCQFAGNGLAPLLPNNKVGGLFSQGPDSFFHKVYCGNNGGVQMHIKSSATPAILDVEFGPSKQPHLYPSLWLERCVDAMVGGGGNCTGWIKVTGAEDDPLQKEYDTECSINFFDFALTLKDKSFTDEDGVVHTLPGYFEWENIRGVHINNVRLDPATDDDAHEYTNRPTYAIYVKGARTTGTAKLVLPGLQDWKWPAGTPEQWPGSQPTNTYDSLTNKPKQCLIQASDPTDTTHAHLFDRIRGLYDDTLEVDGKVEFGGQLQLTGGTILPPTEMTTAIDITKARNDVTLGGNATWTFSGTPQNGTCCTVTVKATGGDRTVTLPASVVDLLTTQTVASFTVRQNAVHHILFEYLFGGWRIGGYPVPDEWVALAASTSYANDAAAAAGGVAVGQRYRNGSAVMVRVA